MSLKKLLLLAVAIVGISVQAEAQLSKVCPTVKEISDRKGLGVLVQWKNNQVQRSGGVGTGIVGFLRNPTIIETQGKRAFKEGRATIYDSKGKRICTSEPRLGCSVSRGECLNRYKFPCASSNIRRATKKGGAFVKVNSKLCVKVPSAGKCYNVKVRDLCDGREL